MSRHVYQSEPTLLHLLILSNYWHYLVHILIVFKLLLKLMVWRISIIWLLVILAHGIILCSVRGWLVVAIHLLVRILVLL